jgi:hypothetical protein
MNDEDQKRPKVSQGLPPVAVRMGILPGCMQRVLEEQDGFGEGDLVFQEVNSGLLRFPGPFDGIHVDFRNGVLLEG